MKVTDFNPLSELSLVLQNAGISDTIYENGVPTSSLPTAFISVMQNGSMKPKTMKMSYAEGFLIISISVKLLSTGEVNSKKEKLILNTIGSLFENNKTIESNNYSFSLDVKNLGTGARGISSGYSTKIINLQVKIY